MWEKEIETKRIPENYEDNYLEFKGCKGVVKKGLYSQVKEINSRYYCFHGNQV